MSRYYQTSMSQPVDFGYELPFQETANALLMKQAQQDQAMGHVQMLGEVQNTRAIDEPGIMAFKNKVDSQIDELSKLDLTSREGKNRYMQLSKEVRSAVGPGGAINAMYDNLAKEQAFVKSVSENKNIEPHRKEAWIRKVTDPNFNPAVMSSEEEGFVGGQYNRYKTPSPLEYVDYAGDLDGFLKGITANSYSKEWSAPKNGYIYKHKNSGKELTEEEVLRTSLDFIRSNPNKYYGYLNEGVQLGLMPGAESIDDIPDLVEIEREVLDPKTGKTEVIREVMPNPQSPIGNALSAVMGKYGFRNIEESDVITGTEAYGFERFKKSLEEEFDLPMIDFETNPTTVTPAKYNDIKGTITTNTSGVMEEIKKVNAIAGTSGLTISPAIAHFNQAQLADQINTLRQQNQSENVGGALDKLISELNNLYASKYAENQYLEEAYKEAYKAAKTPAEKTRLEQYKSQGLFRIGADGGLKIDGIDDYNKYMLKNSINAYNKFLKDPKDKVFNLPSTQSSTFKMYHPDGSLVDEETIKNTNKAVHKLAKDGTVGDALLYEVDDKGHIKSHKQSIGIGSSTVVFDQIPRSDGKMYAIYTYQEGDNIVKKAMDMEAIIVNGEKISGSAASKVDSHVVRMAQERLRDYKFPGTDIELQIDTKGSISSYPSSDSRFFNNNKMILVADGQTYLNNDAVRKLVELENSKKINLLNIR